MARSQMTTGNPFKVPPMRIPTLFEVSHHHGRAGGHIRVVHAVTGVDHPPLQGPVRRARMRYGSPIISAVRSKATKYPADGIRLDARTVTDIGGNPGR
jgi:hypothetical protein